MKRLEQARRALPPPSWAIQDTRERERVDAKSSAGATVISVYYGDITSRSTLVDRDFEGKRKAIVSPEDTMLSVGGGVAHRLLTAAGPRFLLSELAKHRPIGHGTAVATSAGKLPVHYLLHAAGLEIDKNNGEYHLSRESVYQAVADSLRKAVALGVEVVWVPLLGTGAGALRAQESLQAILEGVNEATSSIHLHVNIVVISEGMLEISDVRDILTATSPPFTVLDQDEYDEGQFPAERDVTDGCDSSGPSES